MKGGLRRYTREKIGEGCWRDDTAVTEVFKFGFDGSNAAVHLRLMELFEGRHVPTLCSLFVKCGFVLRFTVYCII